jgi:hypothetical protein
MFTAPLEGWRRAEITEQRTRKDWAGQIKQPADGDFPDAEKIILVMDNLNTHSIASLYETFPAEEAGAWNRRGNQEACKINRRFTTADARIKLKRLYPQFE